MVQKTLTVTRKGSLKKSQKHLYTLRVMNGTDLEAIYPAKTLKEMTIKYVTAGHLKQPALLEMEILKL